MSSPLQTLILKAISSGTRLAVVEEVLLRAWDNANIGKEAPFGPHSPEIPIDVGTVMPCLRRNGSKLLRLIAAPDEAAAKQLA
jgi:hypothetical protein